MQRIDLIGAMIRVVLAPLAGLGLTAYLATEHLLEVWHGGFILCLMFGPTVASDKVSAMAKRMDRAATALVEEEPLPASPGSKEPS